MVSEQPAPPLPTILRDLDVARKLFEAILDTPNGKRSLSRLARTCRAMCEPALDALWKDLDSIVPILGLFPNHVLKKGKRPQSAFGRGLRRLHMNLGRAGLGCQWAYTRRDIAKWGSYRSRSILSGSRFFVGFDVHDARTT